MIAYNEHTVIAGYFHAELSNEAVSLLPIDHARAFPLSFNIKKRSILKGEINFYNKPFYENFDPKGSIDDSKVSLTVGVIKNKKVIIFNVLDNCFGHALLKLFLAVDSSAELKDYDALVIVPKALEHFVKKNTFTHVLVVDQSFKALEKCPILNKSMDAITKNYSTKEIFPIHTYGEFLKEKLVSRLDLFGETKPKEEKNIVFYYRKDTIRQWGSYKQGKKITKLFSLMKPFFSEKVNFIVVGESDKFNFPAWIMDKRTDTYTKENDFEYNHIYANSIMAISITGSHLLLPSLLSKMTIHLHPTYKYKNMAEDIVNSIENSLTAFTHHMNYYGNYNCSNIKPAVLCLQVLTNLQAMMEKEYKLSNSLQTQAEHIAQEHSYFKYKDFQKARVDLIGKENKKHRWSYYLSKLFGY